MVAAVAAALWEINVEKIVIKKGHPKVVNDLRDDLNYFVIYYFSFSACFIARTFNERPKRLINPSASWWS